MPNVLAAERCAAWRASAPRLVGWGYPPRPDPQGQALWLILSPSGVLITLAMAGTAFGLDTWSACGPLFAANYPERLRAMASSGIYNLGRTQQLIAQPLVANIRAGGWDAGALLFGASMAVLSAVLIFAVPQGGEQRGPR